MTINEVVDTMGLAAYLEHVAEEASELTHASLKLARVLRGVNPTPVTEEQAVDNFLEEYADVTLLMGVLLLGKKEYELKYLDTYMKKLNRWEGRLNGEDR